VVEAGREVGARIDQGPIQVKYQQLWLHKDYRY
jgi:hypothetical protein